MKVKIGHYYRHRLTDGIFKVLAIEGRKHNNCPVRRVDAGNVYDARATDKNLLPLTEEEVVLMRLSGEIEQ